VVAYKQNSAKQKKKGKKMNKTRQFNVSRFGRRFGVIVVEDMGMVKARTINADPVFDNETFGGVAKCNPNSDDVFSVEIGIKIACGRALRNELSAENVKALKEINARKNQMNDIEKSVNESTSKYFKAHNTQKVETEQRMGRVDRGVEA
jgi:urease alpha subunit